MKKLALLFSLIAVVDLAHADLRSEIMTARRKQEKAAMAKDLKGVEAAMKESLTPDFKYVQAGVTQDAKTFIKEFSASVVMMDKISSSSSRIISLKESGSKASGEIELSMTGSMKMPEKKGAAMKSHPISYVGLFSEEYRKVGGKWKMSKMTAGKQNFMVDGKPVKM